MRKTLYCIFISLLFVCLTSCSDDDNTNNLKIPHQPQSGEIKMFFNATDNSSEALFYISGGNFTIDWGDGKISTPTDVDGNFYIRHQYLKNKEYVITITTSGKLEYFKNFSALEMWNFKEEKIPVFENISIGKDVDIDVLYIQASGVKKISFANDERTKEANILLGASDWDLSMLNVEKLSVYVANRENLEIKNLNIKTLSITVKDEIDNLSISSCDKLLYLDISAMQQKRATVRNLTVTNLSKLDDIRFYALMGSTAALTNLPALRLAFISDFHYETMNMSNQINSSVDMSLKASGISVSKTIKFSNQLAAVEFNNSKSEVTADIATMDFSMCENLKTVKITGLKSLEELKFGNENNILDEVVLKSLPKLKVLDLSACKNLQKLEMHYATSFETAKFSSKNQLLRNVRFQDSNFSETNCVDIINSLPNFPIPGIPSVNRRLFSIRNNTPSLKDNDKIIEAAKDLRPHWNFGFD